MGMRQMDFEVRLTVKHAHGRRRIPSPQPHWEAKGP